MFIPDQVNTGHAAALTMNHRHLRIRVLEIAGLHDYHTHSVSLGVLLVHFFFPWANRIRPPAQIWGETVVVFPDSNAADLLYSGQAVGYLHACKMVLFIFLEL